MKYYFAFHTIVKLSWCKVKSDEWSPQPKCSLWQYLRRHCDLRHNAYGNAKWCNISSLLLITLTHKLVPNALMLFGGGLGLKNKASSFM